MTEDAADTGRGLWRGAALDRRRLRRWLDAGDWVLAGFAVLFLIGYATPILRPQLDPTLRHVCSLIQLVAWAVFALDYVARVYAAADRRSYFTKHLLDLVIVALPILRPLRLMRLVVLFRILNRKAAASMRGRVASYVTISAATLVFCAGLAVLDAERHARGSNITSFGNAMWWAVTTVTTVGYGDHFPVTVQGRFIAVGLMIGGVALIGVVTASFAAWFIDRVRDTEVEAQAATQHDLEEMTRRLDVLTREIVALRKESARDEAQLS
jgi:voltage-gated potassium channel